MLFEIHDLPCRTASTAEEALGIVRREPIGVAIQDMNFERGRTSGDEGVALFRQLKAIDPDLPVLLITAWTSLETAVQLVKEGASDYLAKPWDDRALVENVERLAASRSAQLEERSGAEHETPPTLAEADLRGLVYASPAMERALSLAVDVARASVPVLITGPNGAGKEMIADIIHANSGKPDRPFVRVNVGALPEELMEAELFGAEPGAFTGARGLRVGRFEAADGGTLLLDEVDALSLAGQVKLLRVLESGEFARLGSSRTRRAEVRVLSATNADLQGAIAGGRFREDLYFRLNVVEIRVPPLARRPEDILPLAEHFLELEAAASGRPVPALADAGRRALLEHPWPGNVRELRNRLQRASLVTRAPLITPEDLDLAVPPSRSPDPAPGPAVMDPEQLEERARVERALVAAGGVVARAAEAMGISRQALYRKMARLDIVIERRPRNPP